ncbi:hypothetical protein [Faecalicatena orotica]|uniref:hypothetical protein n=1 Tax=Faecalicatena orotica TaxID=1544 RepID=UPI00321692A0
MKKNRVKEKITFLMYKVEIKFREDKIEPESAKLLCEQIDRIFEKEDLKCSGSCLERRIYSDKGRKDD